MEEHKAIWQKTQAELTVRDQFVISGTVLGALVGMAVVATAVEKVGDFYRNRKARKNSNVIDVS